ncbi:MAG: peptidylprolyl isomerase [Ruminococcus sp.]|nr:peptidylprolyl isomerase [Ruminococcus sp.]
MFKKISALTAALVLSITVLGGCSNSDSSSSSSDTSTESSSDSSASSTSDTTDTDSSVPDASLVIDGEEMDTDGLIVCTIDGHDVDFDTFRYYYYYTINQYTENYGATLDTIAETDGGFDTLLENTITMIKQEFVTYRLCEENGIELTDEEIEANEETYNSGLESAGSEEEFEAILHDSYMTPDLYKTMLELATLYTKCEDELFTNEGVYATSKDEFREIVQDTDEYACVRSILIPYFCKVDLTDSDDIEGYDSYSLSEKYTAKESAYSELEDDEQEEAKEKAKALADEVYEKAKSGDDFEELIEEYNWDSGMESYPDGYYLTPDSDFIEEYLDTAFSLEVGEISDIIESDTYGYFIVMRYEVDMDYVEENIDDMIQDYDLPARQELYMDIMEDMDVTYSDFYDQLTVDSIT